MSSLSVGPSGSSLNATYRCSEVRAIIKSKKTTLVKHATSKYSLVKVPFLYLCF